MKVIQIHTVLYEFDSFNKRAKPKSNLYKSSSNHFQTTLFIYGHTDKGRIKDDLFFTFTSPVIYKIKSTGNMFFFFFFLCDRYKLESNKGMI